MKVAVEMLDLYKRFSNTEAIAGLSTTIKSGQLTGLVGPDGAGKTTLMRMMAALMSPSEGSLKICGHDVVKDAAAIHQLTGYMPQRFGLYEDLSVMENLDLYGDLNG